MTEKEKAKYHKEKAKWMSELWTAIAEGKQVQYLTVGDNWVDIFNEDGTRKYEPNTHSDPDNWRVLPAPRRMWETPGYGGWCITYNEEEAKQWEEAGASVIEWVEVVKPKQ